eukprot:721779-Amorphochlora_amoeboformis.AAC.1
MEWRAGENSEKRRVSREGSPYRSCWLGDVRHLGSMGGVGRISIDCVGICWVFGERRYLRWSSLKGWSGGPDPGSVTLD